MKKPCAILFFMLLLAAPSFAVETAPRISDKEIIENLAGLRGDIKELKTGQLGLQQQVNDLKASTQQQINDLRESMQQQINDLRESMQQQINELKESTNKRFDDVNRRFDDMNDSVNRRFDDVNKRFDDMNDSVNGRFDILQWMLGLFITVALSLMGIMGRILWNQQKKLTQIETSLEAQKAELSFLKSLIEKFQALIEKLLPPRGVL